MIVNGKRELAYVVKIDDIKPIEGSDNCECAVVGGWQVMVHKNEFKPGDLAVFFEVDSRLDVTKPEFEFLAKRNGKIKTQKYTFGGKGNFISQGLLMSAESLGWRVFKNLETGEPISLCDTNNLNHTTSPENGGLTDILGVTYAVDEDNKRKANTIDPNAKYQSMAARHSNLFKKKPIRWLMRRNWGKRLLFIFFGKKKDNPLAFPTQFPFVHKTDEERIENLPNLLGYPNELVVTEKLDGTSTTFILARQKHKKNKFEFYVVSRNVRQLKPDQECYHENNIYWEMANKYSIESILTKYLQQHPEESYVAIQGESVGNVQGNPLKLAENDFYAFNFITSTKGRIPSIEGEIILQPYDIKWVPILDTHYKMPTTMEEVKEYATAQSIVNPTVLREGVVLRDPTNDLSFKNVSREYLLKHNG